jgi:ferredoxin
MSEVIINFESEKAEGIVAVGTYLIDAAKRLGIKLDCDCTDPEIETSGSCAVTVSKGRTLLSEPTKLETELLSEEARKNGERLACQTKIEKPGEVTIMSVKQKESEEEVKDVEEETKEEFKKQFEELPLEKKISNLVELEAIALSETFSFVVNSPYSAVGKVLDVLAEFGFKIEKQEQEAKRPEEHVEKDETETDETVAAEEKPEKKTSATDEKKDASKPAGSKKSGAKKQSKKSTAKKKSEQKKEDEA